MSRIRRPAAEPPVELSADEIKGLLEEADELGIDVEFELFALGRTPEQIIATARAEAAEHQAGRAAFSARESAREAPAKGGAKHWPVITGDSTREEVLAAVAAHEADAAETKTYLTTLNFPGLDGVENPKAGCYWSEDGNVRVHYRPPSDEPAHLARQRTAGEENQDDGEWAIG